MSDNFSLRAVMKTDIKDFTKMFNEMPEQDISRIMSEHRQFVLNKVYQYSGRVIKGEGDAFWITFGDQNPITETFSGTPPEMNLQKKTPEMNELESNKKILKI